MSPAPLKRTVRIYASPEEAGEAGVRRLSQMTPDERWAEFAILQERAFGEAWTKTPMKKVASWETVDW